jgi:hypothetical protein
MVTFRVKTMDNFIVKCTECQSEHSVKEVEFVNIEEDFIGRDVMYFVCPKTMNETKSLVYKE